MTSPDAAAIAGPSGSGGADADQRTVRPFRSNDSAVLEVPQDRPKRFEPLDAEDHVV
jgi:hypothetical protein